MITFFSIPKAFKGHISVIQQNAIKSWMALRPRPEIILFGRDQGIEETAAEFNIMHIKDVECNEFGTPFLHSIFKKAEIVASNDIVCYINADIIVMSDFIEAIKSITLKKYLMVGSRCDIDIRRHIDFTAFDWEMQFKKLLKKQGTVHPPAGSDYFVFKRKTIKDMPPFIIGRPCWDNWMIFEFRKIGIPVIDASKTAMVVHQNHNYKHIKDGDGACYNGIEADSNRKLLNNPDHLFTLSDVSHLLIKGKLEKVFGRIYDDRSKEHFRIFHPHLWKLKKYCSDKIDLLKKRFPKY